MTSGTKNKRLIGVLAGSAAFALVLAGCQTGGGDDGGGGGDGAILVGTTDKVTTLDPAGSYDNGSFGVQNQVFAFLLNSPPEARMSSPTSRSPPSSSRRPSTRSRSSRASSSPTATTSRLPT